MQESVSLTIPSQKEGITETLASLIRLEFPEWTIWTLPLVAGELGHVVMNNPIIRDPLNDTIQTYADKRQSKLLEQLFPDAYATYTMGPAYACAVMLFRFNPQHAYKNQQKLPCEAVRGQVILQMLERMNATESLQKPWTTVIKQLKDSWELALHQAQPSECLTQQQQDDIKAWVELLWETLKNATFGRYPIEGWTIIEQWSKAFCSSSTPTFVSEEMLVALPCHIINAAWWARFCCPNKSLDEIAGIASNFFWNEEAAASDKSSSKKWEGKRGQPKRSAKEGTPWTK
jgi:hypothetical protein